MKPDWSGGYYVLGFNLMYIIIMYGDHKLMNVTVDEDEGTVTDSRWKQYPLRISRLATVSYKESKKGKFRSIFLHDDGVGYMDIRTSKANADRIVYQLLKINPSKTVGHANYL